MAYASKYYDPQKAHEYYMQHRELKNKSKTPEQVAEQKRRSTASLNEQGKAAAKQVREAIREEMKADFKVLNEGLKANLKKLKAQWKQQGLSKEQIKEKAEQLREKIKNFKKELRAHYKEKYLRELDQIKEDPQFKKVKKKRGRKKKSNLKSIMEGKDKNK